MDLPEVAQHTGIAPVPLTESLYVKDGPTGIEVIHSERTEILSR